MTINDYVTQSSSTWGLARVSHKSRTATGYVYDETAGEGTCAYIIDTGIYVAHSVRSPSTQFPQKETEKKKPPKPTSDTQLTPLPNPRNSKAAPPS